MIRTLLLAAAALMSSRAPGPRYTRIHTLSPKEGVFAYARISPDGKTLVYASETSNPRSGGLNEMETVIDLATHRVLFAGPGIDAYWSPDGKRLIYSSQSASGVTIWHTDGTTTSNVVPGNLGDYYSWAERDGRDLILTILSNYYYLNGDKGVLPHAHVPQCPGIGVGERPLISKDGKRITTFVQGNVVVRGLDNCEDIFNTGVKGAKADFSWDGRYIAFHALKADGVGYDIKVVDLTAHTVRTLGGLKGSSLFPSWTRDGRICFRYDGPEYRGFMMADDVLSAPAEPLPAASPLPSARTWGAIFPNVPAPSARVAAVLVWAPWSAHTRIAFDALEAASSELASRKASVAFLSAADPGSARSDVDRLRAEYRVTIPDLPLTRDGLALIEARNQMPTTLLFRDGVLMDTKLGAQTTEALRAWIGAALAQKAAQ